MCRISASEKIKRNIFMEFPDYDDVNWQGIKIPAGFKGSSWHNDTCPSILNEELGIKIFIDYKNKEAREFGGIGRFSLNLYSKEDDQYDQLFDTDDWNDILKYIYALNENNP